MATEKKHIEFDDLLILARGNLELREINLQKKHLEICEACQNNYEAIKNFKTIPLRMPYIKYEEKKLDGQLLKISRQNSNPFIKCFRKVKSECYYLENKVKLLAAISLMLFMFYGLYSKSNSFNKTKKNETPPLVHSKIIELPNLINKNIKNKHSCMSP